MALAHGLGCLGLWVPGTSQRSIPVVDSAIVAHCPSGKLLAAILVKAAPTARVYRLSRRLSIREKPVL